MKPVRNSVLLKTSSRYDCLYSNGNLTVTGGTPIALSTIQNIVQKKYRAEIAQVVTVGDGSYTPAASTKYAIYIGDVNRNFNGSTESLKLVGYTTPADITTLGATAALQREAIHAQLVTKINALNLYCTAVSLGTGSGFKITDNAGYYPVRAQGMSNREGATMVVAAQNSDGTGFDSTEVTVSTAAVYSFGVGANLLASAPVMDFMTGNLISGYEDAPKTATGALAVSGQNYDAFLVSSLVLQPVYSIRGAQAYSFKEDIIYVDNGTGSSTTNLSGFIAFEKEMHRIIADINKASSSTFAEFFDSPTLLQGASGAVPTTTGQNKIATNYEQFVYNNIGTNTITVPTPQNGGLELDQDLTDTEGAEYTPSLLTNAPREFKVGAQPISVFYRQTVTDHTDATVIIGLRKKASHQPDFNDYTDLAAIGTLGDLVYTWGILNNAATVATNTTIVPTDSASETFEIRVDMNGLVTALYNNVEYPVYSAGTTPLILDAGDIVIPTLRAVNIGGGDPTVIAEELLALPTDSWRS